MKKGFFLLLFQGLLLFSQSALSAELSAINFHQEGEISRLELSLDRDDVKADRFHVTEDKQIVIDLENVTATDRVLRPFDTSEFSGSVVFVSA